MSMRWDSEAILVQFRRWLDEVSDQAEEFREFEADAVASGPPTDAVEPSPQRPEMGLVDLVEAFTAMRQELKLQTKSQRNLEQTVAQAREGLDLAIRQFQSVQVREAQVAERTAVPLIETLASLDESLWRASQAFETIQDRVAGAVSESIAETVRLHRERLPAWRRWAFGASGSALERQCTAAAEQAARGEMAALLEGFELLRTRMRQELDRHKLRRLSAVGELVDPSCMMVVALANAEEGPPESVVAEIRPGYIWHDRVIRPAEVRAVPSRPDRSVPPEGSP